MNKLVVDIVLIASRVNPGKYSIFTSAVDTWIEQEDAKVIQRGIEIPLAYTDKELEKMAFDMVMKANHRELTLREQNEALKAEIAKLKGE